jgi:hypothetical protein
LQVTRVLPEQRLEISRLARCTESAKAPPA